MQIVIGTAGHIDHGKTSLVKALTGTDTDNLIEEKNRGMTIDLGFAYLNEDITICIFEQLSIDRQAVIPELALIPLYMLPLKVNLPSLKLITLKLYSKDV